MASFSLSPAVVWREIDLSGYIPAVSISEGAFAGVFRWGPIDERTLVDQEDTLRNMFGAPTNFNPETWFTAKSFLDYGSRLYISRAADVTGNTIIKSFVGSQTEVGNAATQVYVAQQDNAAILLANATTGNTNFIEQGYVLFYSNSVYIPAPSTVLSVNSTHVVLDAPATGNVTGAQLLFREDIVYTAVAQQSDITYEPADISDWDAHNIKNEKHYDQLQANGIFPFDSSVLWIARFPGEIGNSLRVSVVDSASQFRSNTVLGANAQFNSTETYIQATVGSTVLDVSIAPASNTNPTNVGVANAHAAELADSLSVGDRIELGNNRIGYQYLKVVDVGPVINNSNNSFTFTVTLDDDYKLAGNVRMNYLQRYWEFYNEGEIVPGQSNYMRARGNTAAADELHVVVVDEGGKFSGSPGTVLEIHRGLSRAKDAKSDDGTNIYYKDYVNQRSQYIWWANDRTTAPSQNAAFVSSSLATKPLNMRLFGGSDGRDEKTVPFGTLAFAYDTFQSAEEIDIALVMQGKARGEGVTNYTQLGNYIIDNIAERRLDCVAFLSPDFNDVVNNIGHETIDVIDFRNSVRGTSYGVMDSGYGKVYDKYNDVYRWVPLNGHIAGLCARVDNTNDPWWSPGGLNRGVLKNIVELAWNPRKAYRDELYKNGVNPVVTFPGQGTVLWGDKTLLPKPSAFDRINVRRLFIVLEKSISTAAKYLLFEFNDAITRAQFRNMVNPYLRDVKGRRGIYDFYVQCDATNNTPEVIDRNEFVASIYIKPAKSINFILLNFVAVRTGVSFSEIVGSVFN